MKKLFYLAIVALLAVNFTFTSCSKDDDDEKDSLAGTTWSVSSEGNSIILSFETDERYELELSGPDVDEVTVRGTYTYSNPNVILYDSSGDEMHGTIKGNRITLSYDEYEFILTKD